MKILNLGLGGGMPDEKLSSKWVDAVRILHGETGVTVTAIHAQATEPIWKSALGEPVSDLDHLFVILSGSVVASGGGQIRIPATAGQAIYWPRNEGFLVFATEALTGLLIEGNLALDPSASED